MKNPKQSKAHISQKTDPVPSSSIRQSRILTRADAKSSRRTDALFRAMSADYLLREQFVTDPAQVMSEYVLGERLPEESSDAANQLLYSMMSSPGLRDWMAKYSRHLNGATPTRHEFALQFARALATHGDEFTSLALIRGSAEGRDHFVVQADLLRAILAVIGGRFSSGGTEMSPGGGTEMSPGGTEMSPGAVFAGTEMSPGGGTEMSPGALVGRLPGYLQVTLSALIRYSSQLRARGALFVSGLEGR